MAPPPVLVYMLVVPSASDTKVTQPSSRPISTSAPQTDFSGALGAIPTAAGGWVRINFLSP
jgi:hypothetical protein